MQAIQDLESAHEARERAQRQVKALSWELRELHVANCTRGRILDTITTSLETRLMQTNQQLQRAVPATTYFQLLDRHMSVVQDRRTHMSLSNLNKQAYRKHCVQTAEMCVLHQHYLDVCKTAADREEECRQAKLMLASEAPQVDQELATELRQRSMEARAAEATAQLATEKSDRLADEVNHARALNTELRQQLSSEAQSTLRFLLSDWHGHYHTFVAV